MPVTAKLSRKFYERFGDDIATELVDWFNAVDLTYQTQLREMNDLNWERFKATLLAESASIRTEFKATLLAETASIRIELRTGHAELRTEMEQLRTEMTRMGHSQIKWMFVFWMGSVVTLGGLIVAVIQAR